MRRIIFWTHLSVGISVALFVFFMSATGVLLTYEHKIIQWVAANDRVEAPDGTQRRSLDDIARRSKEISPDARSLLINIHNRDDAPITLQHRGQQSISLNPYSGDIIETSAEKTEAFFHVIVELHRWLALDGSNRQIGRAITGAANLLFLFLILSGIYLWLPRVWKWVFLKQNLFFMKKPPTGKARDYNWHHVFGSWALIPLFLIVLSGVVISYPWASDAVYRVYGEEPPAQRGPPEPPSNQGGGRQMGDLPPITEWASLEDAFAVAKSTNPSWTTISFVLMGDGGAPMATFQVNDGDGFHPRQRTTVVINRTNREIARISGYDEMSAGQKARIWMRFIHTGEEYGLIGATIAGLASLAACFLVYTGLALSYRRFFKRA